MLCVPLPWESPQPFALASGGQLWQPSPHFQVTGSEAVFWTGAAGLPWTGWWAVGSQLIHQWPRRYWSKPPMRQRQFLAGESLGESHP